MAGLSRNGRNKGYRYYDCSTRKKTGAKACSPGDLRADALEEAIADLMVDAYQDTGAFVAAAHQTYDNRALDVAPRGKRLGASKKELAKVQADIERLVSAIESATLAASSSVGERLTALEDQAKALRAEADQSTLDL